MMAMGLRPVAVVQVGIGGMGFFYCKSLLEDFPSGRVRIEAAVDPYPERSALFAELKKRNIPVYKTLAETFGRGISADLVVIASPLQHHIPQCLDALKDNCCVLCEKPLAPTVQDADRLIRALEASKHWVEVGYQWSFSESIQKLKRDIKNGRFGRPVRIKAFYLWPRDVDYYNRNDWAGRIKDSEGRWILDSPANSAMAHDLHNLFFLLGEKADRSSQPIQVEAELFRAYPVENYDTIACRGLMRSGVEFLFYASHAVREIRGPMFCLEMEDAVVSFGEESKEIVAELSAGRILSYGSPEKENPFRKLFESVGKVWKPGPVLCGPEAARSQVLTVNGIQDSAVEIVPFSPPQLQGREGRFWVEELPEVFYSCYRKNLLPSEAGYPLARPGRKVDLDGYCFYPGGSPPEKSGGLGT